MLSANADHFAISLREAIAERADPIHWIVITAEPITVAVAELTGHVKDRLHLYGPLDRIGENLILPTVGSAMRVYYLHLGFPNPTRSQ